jgi:hypothetical protein
VEEVNQVLDAARYEAGRKMSAKVGKIHGRRGDPENAAPIALIGHALPGFSAWFWLMATRLPAGKDLGGFAR